MTVNIRIAPSRAGSRRFILLIYIKANMLWLLLGALLLIPATLANSACPPRRLIHPCNCINIAQSKRANYTVIVCQNLQDTDELNRIMPSLTGLDIAQFHLSDSFWNASEDKQVLPKDWPVHLNAKELVIIDSALSSCFACQMRSSCENNLMTEFTVSNSSSNGRICNLCDANAGPQVPWTGCLKKLRKFTLSHGGLSTLSGDLFPAAMAELTDLDLSHNRINKLDPNSFKNLPALANLDLSHNDIEFFDHAFVSRSMKLKMLDLSYNSIKRLWDNTFLSFPELRILRLGSNSIQNLTEMHWRGAPKSLYSIDLSNNLLQCDCSIRWVNATFKAHVAISGACSTPEEYSSSPIRQASRHLIERCDSSGNPTRPRLTRKRNNRRQSPQQQPRRQ